MTNEFSLINSVINKHVVSREDVILGIGDDAAILDTSGATRWMTSVDTMVAGVHFFSDVDPYKLGYKALAVNLSDIAAMGGTPKWALLALTLPKGTTADWVSAFMAGFGSLAAEHNTALVGGDTTSGPLTVSVTIIGSAESEPLCRHTAQLEDQIWVTGTLGDAAYAVQERLAKRTAPTVLAERLDCPTPRVALMRALRPHVHAAIDLSDGLAGDLLHVLNRSEVGADVELSKLPISQALATVCTDVQACWNFAAGGGDDYEICFTAKAASANEIATIAGQHGVVVTCIGQIKAEPGLRWLENGERSLFEVASYQHTY